MSEFPPDLSLTLRAPSPGLPLAPGGLAPVGEWRPSQGVSPGARRFAEDVRAAGGVALIVGGWVRDGLLGAAPKDEDIEVYGLSPEAVAAVANRRSVPVGSGFGILKVGPLDVTFPRARRRMGVGPDGWQEDVDPNLGLVDAARRRDLTLNALAWEPLSGALYDPFDGLNDLAARHLRWVDGDTFVEDPIRALRVIQLMARLDGTVDSALVARLPSLVGAVCESPRERIWTEIEGLLMKGRVFGAAFDLARRVGLLGALLPPLMALDDGAWAALCRSLSFRRETQTKVDFEERCVALGCLLSPLPEEARLPLLESLTQEKRLLMMAPTLAELAPQLAQLGGEVGAGGDIQYPLRTLARRVPLDLALRLHHCLYVGRHDTSPPHWKALMEAVDAAGVSQGPLPQLLSGGDLIKAGLSPGPGLGRLLEAAYQAQMQGLVTTKSQALALAMAMSG